MKASKTVGKKLQVKYLQLGTIYDEKMLNRLAQEAVWLKTGNENGDWDV